MFGESLASQTGGKGKVSTNDGRTSKKVRRVYGESNWREGKVNTNDGRTSKKVWRVYGESNWREGKVSTNDGRRRTSKKVWRVLGESNWREGKSQYQWREKEEYHKTEAGMEKSISNITMADEDHNRFESNKTWIEWKSLNDGESLLYIVKSTTTNQVMKRH
jgi:hypothetical protein